MGIFVLFPFVTFFGAVLVYGISSIAGIKPEYERIVLKPLVIAYLLLLFHSFRELIEYNKQFHLNLSLVRTARTMPPHS